MDNPLLHKLAPESLENQYRESRKRNDRKQLLRIFGLTATLVSLFIALELPNVSHVLGARLAALLAAAVGFWKVRRSFHPTADEPFIFGCGLIVILHILVNHFIQRNDLVSIAAWDIAIIFAVYSLVPIGIHYQAALALILSIGSQLLWIMLAVPQLSIFETIATPMAYLAANCVGIMLSLNLNRSQRQAFKTLQNEQTLKSEHEQAMATLQNTVNSRNQLFSVLAHDLRGPIGALSTIGELLDSANPIQEAQRERLINLLCVGAKTSGELLDNLLNWALSATGNLEPHIAPVPLQNAIEANIDLLSTSASNKDIRLSTQSSQRLTIYADPKMLDTILRNLIANAIKFTGKGGEIKISHQRSENDTVKIYIEDNGIGIEPSRLEHLFNLKSNDTSEGTAGEHGSNLGLRICADFTAKQGGEIEVDSTPGKGTKMTLTFPIAPRQTNEERLASHRKHS